MNKVKTGKYLCDGGQLVVHDRSRAPPAVSEMSGTSMCDNFSIRGVPRSLVSVPSVMRDCRLRVIAQTTRAG